MYQRGRKTIDTILCTGGANVVNAGYMSLCEWVGDHRILFIDVTIVSTLGVDMPSMKSAKA